jgi:hypothetical protein
MTQPSMAGFAAPALSFDHSDSGLTPAQHRTAVAVVNAKRADPVLSWPTLSRLQKAGRTDLVQALLDWRELTSTASIGSANDNNRYAGIAEGVHVERFADATTTMGEDGEWEVRPTVPAMLKAAEQTGPFTSRVSVRSSRNKAGWSEPETCAHNRLVRAPYPQHEYFFYGRLLFGPMSGRNKQKGSDWRTAFSFIGIVEQDRRGSWKKADGRWNIKHRPTETWRRDRSAPKSEKPAAPYYLTPGVAILKGAEFIALAPKATTAPANDNDATAEIIRSIECAAVRKELGTQDADVLDMAASPMTSTEIGEHFGRQGQYARRWAVQAVDGALARWAELRLQPNVPQNGNIAA